MWIIGGVIGLLLGAATDESGMWFAGAIIGGISGWAFKTYILSKSNQLDEIRAQLLQLENTVKELTKRIDILQNVNSAPEKAPENISKAATASRNELYFTQAELQKETAENNILPLEIPLPTSAQKPQAVETPAFITESEYQAGLVPEQSSLTSEPIISTPLRNVTPREPNWFDHATQKVKETIRQFIFGGNTLVKVGSLILFLGLAFLLRYAAGQITIPIEWRYGGVAASAFALLGFGWKLRENRRDYALILQGLAVGVMYLTILASMKLHPLLPAEMGFVMLVIVSACSAVLAVKQNSLALAIAGSLGGFAAPILSSTGGGSHISLFSYLALLDAGIVAVAWFRAWRVLNLLGFIGTFGLFMAWFVKRWQIEYLLSAELFLLLFFAMFVMILIRFAHHLSLSQEALPKTDAERDGVLLNVSKRVDYVDGTLAFGVPLVTFGLHAQMVSNLEFGSSFGALFLGAIYLALASGIQKISRGSYLLLVEVFIALGVVFASLAIPLGLDPLWTASAWAVEAVGIFWIGIRQQRPLARLFASLLMIGSVINFFRTLHVRYIDDNILLNLFERSVFDGSIFGACLIACSLIFLFWLLRRAPENSISKIERNISWLPALAGSLMTYCLPPLLLPFEYCGMAWGFLGLATLYFALRFAIPACVWSGFLIQLFAGISFAATLHGGTGTSALGNGYSGLFSAMVIGGAMLAGAWIATAKLREAGPRLAGALHVVSGVTVVGLSLLNLAFLFVLPMQSALTAWALTSTLIVALALRLGNRIALWFALILEILAGLMVLTQRGGVGLFSEQQTEQLLLPFQNSGWWSALVFSLCGFIGAWLLKRVERKGEQVPVPNFALLLWASLWWGFAWIAELHRWLPENKDWSALVVLLVATQLLWWAVARWQDWNELRRFTYSHLPISILLTLTALTTETHPMENYGWLVWPLAIATHFFLLHVHKKLIAEELKELPHVGGVWWILILLSFETRWYFSTLGDDFSAWPKLGWALLPLAYLWWAGNWSRPSPWPLTQHLDAYRRIAAIPVAILLTLWLFIINFASNGSAEPLPYIPLLNPLEITLIAGMLVIVQWTKIQPTTVETSFMLRAGIIGYGFLTLTAGVFRAVHHWLNVPWQLEQMLASTNLQVALSVVWTVAACLTLLIASKLEKRALWLAGAALIAIVVVKLILVELSKSNTVARIISFMVVGVLLLLMGYFAPVPPKKNPTEMEPAS